MSTQYDLFGSSSAINGEASAVHKTQDGVFLNLTGSEQAKRLYSLLSDGCKYSVVDIMQQLYIGDPRSVIRTLRNSGVVILDEWRSDQSGNRYKVYWIKKG